MVNRTLKNLEMYSKCGKSLALYQRYGTTSHKVQFKSSHKCIILKYSDIQCSVSKIMIFIEQLGNYGKKTHCCWEGY